MSVVVVGLEHQKAPLSLLERVAIPGERLAKTLSSLADNSNLTEVVVLSTCLRTELYAVVDRFHEGVDDLQGYLAAMAGSEPSALSDNLTVLFDDAVAVHLFEVAAGLRSAVLGETEVLGQVRRAAERATEERAAGPVLQGLFARAVAAGRKVRSSTAIAQGSTSLSHIAVELARRRLDRSLQGSNAVVVGAGEIGRAVCGALSSAGANVTVANRTRRSAEALASSIGGRAVGLRELPEMLGDADLLMVTTSASSLLVEAETVLEGMRRRALARPLVVVDLGVPRNVDPAAAALSGVELHDMDSLRAHAQLAMAGRRAEVTRAEMIIQGEVERFRVDSRARGAAPIVSSMRSHLEALRREELERRRGRSASLADDQWAEVDAITSAVLAKLLHQPSVALKDAAGTPRGERLVEALRILFDL